MEDAKYYSLDSLPEFGSLLIQCWPGLFARMAQQFPRATVQQGKRKSTDLAADSSSRGRGKDIEAGQSRNSGAEKEQF